MDTHGLTDLFETTSLNHYSVACLVRHAFGRRYRCQEIRRQDRWCFMDEKGVWWSDGAVYHTLRTAISSELAPFLRGHIAWLIRHRTHEAELIDRLQRLEQMLLDAPQKDWILKECKSLMFWDPPVETEEEMESEAESSEAESPAVKLEPPSPYTFYI
jgi:hypothetical protein